MAENFVNIIREIRGSTNDPATDTYCIYGDMKDMHEEYKGFKQITDEERLKLENIEEEATKNSTDGFLLARENHTGNMSIANVQDTPSRMAMTIHEKNKLEAIPQNATANDTDANLRNRATHTGTQSADSIVDGLVNAAYTLNEKNKLSVLSTTVPPAHTHDNTSITSLEYSKLTGVPVSFNPSKHLHSMDEITTGNLDATRINQTNSLQFVNNVERERLAISETTDKKGVPFGYVPLDGNGKINPSYLDALNVIDVFTPINREAMLLLTSAKPGDIAYVQDSQNTYMLVALPVHIQENWKQMNSGSGVITFNGLNGVVSVGTDEIPEGSANIYFTNERVDDRVANILTPGANVSIVYNDDTNQIIISANDTSAEWSEIQNKPSPNISVEIAGDASGSANATLTELASGSIEINNLTLKDTGTAGTYRKITTDSKGRVISGESATTIAEYEITDAYTKTEIANLFVKLTGNQTIDDVKTFSSSPIVPTPTTDFQSVPLRSTNITVNVGAGQTYTTINQALEYLSGFYPMYKRGGVKATINLKAGFAMAEQVLVSGIDLGWITIVGEDAETLITHTALTTAFNGSHYPAFGVDKYGVSPVIGQLFRFNVEKVGENKHGIMAYGAGSSAEVLNGKGFIGAGNIGIYALNGSIINAQGANVSNAGTNGIYAIAGSIINANNVNVSNAGDNGIYARRGSIINAYGAIVQNQTTGTARLRVTDGSHIEATDINTSGGTVTALSQTANTLTSNGIIYQ